MGDLNNDWVLWGSIGAVVLTLVALIGFAWKAARGIEGLEKDDADK
ncbi:MULTISPECIES: hypothetical protein [Thiomicrorhabdus]|uniref:Uncharacterized protein n=1 Tax=Thiomicrorhabdus heinhorstiae TaxID=2748010 RepID=A0ABS0BUE6_9GAMM|nr:MULTISPECIES: hypothetical protein [Thiomicrorhabdus]MBF6057461.1 hypothetical protein [Thiomicrorhabdus heinhorstiae]